MLCGPTGRRNGWLNDTKKTFKITTPEAGIFSDTCHSRCRLHMSEGETLKDNETDVRLCPAPAESMSTMGAARFTIMSRHGFAASLLEAEHQVDPLMKVLGHVLTLQCRPVLMKEIAGIWEVTVKTQ